jgi:hypothetical protein
MQFVHIAFAHLVYVVLFLCGRLVDKYNIVKRAVGGACKHKRGSFAKSIVVTKFQNSRTHVAYTILFSSRPIPPASCNVNIKRQKETKEAGKQ